MGMGRLLLWLAGAQPEILAHCKQDRAKYIGIGSAVLVTASMAVVSMSFALHMALNASLATAIPFALAWGLAIMSLDRWLVVSLVRQSLLRYLMLALPRLLLGLLFGIIISTPLTLQIFHVEIANQMSVDHTNAQAAYNNSTAVAQLTSSVSADQQTVAKYQAVINGGGGAGMSAAQDPTLVSLNQQLASNQQQAKTYYTDWHCEVYGGCGPTYVVGNGKAAQTDYKNYQYYTGQAQSDQKQIAAAQTQLGKQNAANAATTVANAKTDLIPAQAKLGRDQSSLTALKQNYKSTLASDTGILARLQALDELRMSSPTLFVAEFLLFLFFTSIEWLPILVKVLLNLGPENTYEKLLARADQSSLRNAENQATIQYLASVRDRDVLADGGATFNTQWQQDVMPQLIDEAIAVRAKVARAKLASWEAKAMASSADTDGYDDIFTPGGFSRAADGPVPNWVRPSRRRRPQLRPRLAAAWQGLRRGPVQHPAKYPAKYPTGPFPAAGRY
jgi:hypothetical protein